MTIQILKIKINKKNHEVKVVMEITIKMRQVRHRQTVSRI